LSRLDSLYKLVFKPHETMAWVFKCTHMILLDLESQIIIIMYHLWFELLHWLNLDHSIAINLRSYYWSSLPWTTQEVVSLKSIPHEKDSIKTFYELWTPTHKQWVGISFVNRKINLAIRQYHCSSPKDLFQRCHFSINLRSIWLPNSFPKVWISPNRDVFNDMLTW
jgi:hypothetical protein